MTNKILDTYLRKELEMEDSKEYGACDLGIPNPNYKTYTEAPAIRQQKSPKDLLDEYRLEAVCDMVESLKLIVAELKKAHFCYRIEGCDKCAVIKQGENALHYTAKMWKVE